MIRSFEFRNIFESGRIGQQFARDAAAQFAVCLELFLVDKLVSRRLIGKIWIGAPIAHQFQAQVEDQRGLEQDQLALDVIRVGNLAEYVPLLRHFYV